MADYWDGDEDLDIFEKYCLGIGFGLEDATLFLADYNGDFYLTTHKEQAGDYTKEDIAYLEGGGLLFERVKD